MRQYNLGPNGAITTSLNLLCSQINILIEKVEQISKEKNRVILVDTPGQIEVFTWSASGQIILGSLRSVLPTSILFVSDGVRCSEPNTFMTNMLFCCSVLLRFRVPLIVLISKADLLKERSQIEWMKDYQKLLNSLQSGNQSLRSNFSKSLCLALDKFYQTTKALYVSALTQEGLTEIDSLLPSLEKQFQEF